MTAEADALGLRDAGQGPRPPRRAVPEPGARRPRVPRGRRALRSQRREAAAARARARSRRAGGTDRRPLRALEGLAATPRGGDRPAGAHAPRRPAAPSTSCRATASATSSGCVAREEGSGAELGEVADVLAGPAHDILELAPAAAAAPRCSCRSSPELVREDGEDGLTRARRAARARVDAGGGREAEA